AARDVVHDRGARLDRALCDLRAVRVDRQDGSVAREALDHGDDARQLLLGSDGLGSRTRRLAADVEDRGAQVGEVARVRDRRLGAEVLAAVAERVGRRVDNAHDLDHASRPFTCGWPVCAFCTPMMMYAAISARAASVLSSPRAATVTVELSGRRSPLARMHSCSASSMTKTPRAARPVAIASATCSPSRSCTCGRDDAMSSTFASDPSPTTRSPGKYAMCARPSNGSRWCSHIERKPMSRTSTEIGRAHV